jgi:hypothetical protein
MYWKDVVYWGFLAGSALLFSYLMLDIIRDYSTLAKSPTESAACCISGATSTVAIACGVMVLSGGIFLIRKQMKV